MFYLNKRKVASLLLASMLAVGASVQASAANITIDGVGTTYKAYKLLNLTTSLKGGTHEAPCDGTTHNDKCYNYSYTMNPDYQSYISAAAAEAKTGLTFEGDGELINAIRDFDADTMRKFADSLYKKLLAANKVGDITSTGDTFSNVDQGYYLIYEDTVGATPDTKSLVMLDTMGQEEVTVKAKESKPTLTKKIIMPADGSEPTAAIANNVTLSDAVDLKAGDKVKFRLTGTLPADYDTYSKYKYVFHDTIASGLTIDPASIRVYISAKDAQYTNADKVDSTKVTVTNPGADCSFEVGFADLKALNLESGHTITSDSVITMTYLATVNDTADSGNPGNDNTAHLEFSNDPYFNGAGDPPTDNTPDDKNVVLTYDVVVNKVDGNGDPLTGAEFTLQKKGAGADEWVDVGDATVAGSTFTFSKLDAGIYKLHETKVPDGYRQAKDVQFTIEAEIDGDDEESEDPKLTNLIVKDAEGNVISGNDADSAFTINLTEGSASTNVVNSPGTELPGAGGSGTYAFYIGGAVMLLGVGGVVAVITKRKSRGSDNN